MPIYEYQCEKCKQISEFIIFGDDEQLTCKKCGGKKLVKLMSAHSSHGISNRCDMPMAGGCAGNPNLCGMQKSCCMQG